MKSVLEEFSGNSYLKFFPCGYEFPISLPVIAKGKREGTGFWTWNGNLESPTLRPSIKIIHADGKISHIWLTNGICQYLDDSTDGLSGQFLPLKELE